jgi:signal transduction histidine kinase
MDVYTSSSSQRLGLSQRPRLVRAPAWAGPALAVAVSYYLAARLGFAFTLQPSPISLLWPPNALLLAALLLAPTAWWPLLVAAVLPAHLLAELQSGVPMAMVLGWYASNCSEALIGAVLVRAFVPGRLRLDSVRSMGVFLLGGALAGPLLSSFIDAALVRAIGWGERSFSDLVMTRLLSNVLAALTIAPLVLGWASFRFASLSRKQAAGYAEAAALFIGLGLACLAVFDLPQVNARATPALFYLPLPFLLWAAVRLGVRGLASALALLVLAAIFGTAKGLGPFSVGSPQAIAWEVQLFLTALAVPMLLFAAALEERARAERDARVQRSQLAHLSRVAMLGELSGGIAHELNQPLTAILSNAQAAQHFLAGKSADSRMLAEIMEDIIAADRRAGDVIRRLHALFKRGEAQLAPLDINDLVRDVVRIVNGDLLRRSVEVGLRLSLGLPGIEGDRVELQQLLLNLVMNACEAMSDVAPGGRQLTIRTQRAPDGGVQVSVADTGAGFDPEQHEQLFEPFYTTKGQGLGLGLSISRAIARAHRGRLWGSANSGPGATFHVALPGAAAKP